MSQRFKADVPSHEPTAPDVFFRRREFVSLLALDLLAAPLDLCASPNPLAPDELLRVPIKTPPFFPAKRNANYALPDVIGRKTLTPREVAAAHNNFYEFLPGHGGACRRLPARALEGRGGRRMAKPRTFDLDDLFKFEHQERLYHFRCMERWAMNVPWTGFPLRELLENVEPTVNAKFVRFVSAKIPDQMPGLKSSVRS